MKIWLLSLLILSLFVLHNPLEIAAQNKEIKHLQDIEIEQKNLLQNSVFQSLGKYYDVPNNKTWSFTFSQNINPKSIARQSVYVLDEDGRLVDSLIINDSQQTITILPPPNRYTEEQSYTIYFTTLLTSNIGDTLLNNYQLSFSIGNSENLITDTEDDLQYKNLLENPIMKTNKNDNNDLDEFFDIIKINEKRHNDETMSNSYREHPFLYTPNTFYIKMKELLIRMYTPPVYY